jgi:hypothetical protein
MEISKHSDSIFIQGIEFQAKHYGVEFPQHKFEDIEEVKEKLAYKLANFLLQDMQVEVDENHFIPVIKLSGSMLFDKEKIGLIQKLNDEKDINQKLARNATIERIVQVHLKNKCKQLKLDLKATQISLKAEKSKSIWQCIKDRL